MNANLMHEIPATILADVPLLEVCASHKCVDQTVVWSSVNGYGMEPCAQKIEVEYMIQQAVSEV
jgi:hypothetical protein